MCLSCSSDPSTKLVSLTLTEKGYCYCNGDGDEGEGPQLRLLDDEDLQHDLKFVYEHNWAALR